MDPSERIYIAGHAGMVGSAIVRALRARGFDDLVVASRADLDLTDAAATLRFLREARPSTVILCAARVGGIEANRTHPALFLYENLAIQNAVIHGAHLAGVKRLVFLGSSCVYPRACPQPMKEEHLLTGPLEPTNEGYAIAKIAGLRMAQYYEREHGMRALCPMPCNLYGPNDSFDPVHSHVLSALVRKLVDATREGRPEVVMWGTGSARRELLHVDDCAEAVMLLMERWPGPEIVNVGSGVDFTIKELAELVAARAGYAGRLAWDASKPDGMPRKCLDISRIAALGFAPKVSLERGVDMMIADYRALLASGRASGDKT